MSESFCQSIAQLADAAKERHLAAFYPAEISRVSVIAAESLCGLISIQEMAYHEQDRRLAAQSRLDTALRGDA